MCKVKQVLLFTLIIGSLSIGSISTTWAGPAEEAALMADKWFKAFYDGDAEAISALYAKDASFFAFLSPFRVEGREGIRASFAGLFKSFPTRALVKRHFYVQVYDTTVVRTYYFTMTLGDAKGTIKSYHGRADIVYMIVDGKRVIVTHHSSLLPN